MTGAKWRGWAAAGLAALSVAGLALRAEAEPGDSGVWTFGVDNDVLNGADDNYSNGLRVSYTTAENDVPDWLFSAAQYVPMFKTTGDLRAQFDLGQNIFTPHDITDPDPPTTDRPYAGWTYVGAGLASESEGRLDRLYLDIGMVGPASGAEWVQKNWHRAFGFNKPMGWDTQLKNEPGLILGYERNWSLRSGKGPLGMEAEALPFLGGAVGNIYDYAATGVTFRFGADIPDDYGPPLVRPSRTGSDWFAADRASPVGWYFFAGVEGRAVARDIFLDGNTFADSRSVDKNNFVGSLQFGGAITFRQTRISLTQIVRTREFKGQPEPDSFLSLAVSTRF